MAFFWEFWGMAAFPCPEMAPCHVGQGCVHLVCACKSWAVGCGQWLHVTVTSHTWEAPQNRYLAKNLWSEMFAKHFNIEKYINEFYESLLGYWKQLCGNRGQTYHLNRWWFSNYWCVHIQQGISILQQRPFICIPPNVLRQFFGYIYKHNSQIGIEPKCKTQVLFLKNIKCKTQVMFLKSSDVFRFLGTW